MVIIRTSPPQTITMNEMGTPNGAIIGTLTYTSSLDGSTRPFGSSEQNADARLIDSTGHDWLIGLPDDMGVPGHYTELLLPIGTYRLTGHYTAPTQDGRIDGKTYFIDKTIQITAGVVNGDANGTAGGS